LADHGVTQAAAGPAFHQAYLAAQRARPDRRLFPCVRAFVSGGAPKSVPLHHDLVAEMGVGTVSGYGSTEAPVVTMASPTDPPETLALTEGRISPGMEVRIVRDDGTVAAPGETGEIRVRGPHVCLGYVDAALDAEAFDADGFFRTGDLGSVDGGGYLSVTGRIKDIIIRGGENISALEVEGLLQAHPKVADVAVIGLPDDRLGERACAVVRSSDPNDPLGLEEMVDFLASARLARQKIPEQLEHVEEIPRNPAGKVLKQVLRERFQT
jgi:acyl-CoA synthetase (AMP-forming)/AMP-acid ligase II